MTDRRQPAGEGVTLTVADIQRERNFILASEDSTPRKALYLTLCDLALRGLQGPSVAEIDAHVTAQHMGGDDRYAIGYNAGVAKMAYLWKRSK